MENKNEHKYKADFFEKIDIMLKIINTHKLENKEKIRLL